MSKRLTKIDEEGNVTLKNNSGKGMLEALVKLADIEDRIEDKEAFIFPCKVGDTIYWVNDYRDTPHIEEYKVQAFLIRKDRVFVQIDFCNYLCLDEICVSKFAANRALKELKNEK